MKTLAFLTFVLVLSGCLAAEPPPSPPSCKLDLIACPAGYSCNIFTDVCEPCSDGGVCGDAGR